MEYLIVALFRNEQNNLNIKGVKMKTNIILPYRPLTRGNRTAPDGDIYQAPDGRWLDTRDGQYKYSGETRGEKEKDDLIESIKYLNDHCYYKHIIIVIMDRDVYPNDTYLKEFDNVKILKTSYIHTGEKDGLTISNCRMNTALFLGIHSIPDEEWLCFAYLSDTVCIKNWDKPIIDAIKEYGDEYVYVPMFVEVYGGLPEATPDRIWNEWRKNICCHALRMPLPEKGYFTEKDMDDYIKIANEAKKGIIIERPGDRLYGIWASMFMKAKYAKKAMRMIAPKLEPPYDLDFDNRLWTECDLLKVIITNSFLFHCTAPFRNK